MPHSFQIRFHRVGWLAVAAMASFALPKLLAGVALGQESHGGLSSNFVREPGFTTSHTTTEFDSTRPYRSSDPVTLQPQVDTPPQNLETPYEIEARLLSNSSVAIPLRRTGPESRQDVLDSATSLAPVIKALALVLGLFFGAIWVFRKYRKPFRGPVVPDIFEPLGEFPINGKHNLVVVRFGPRLLVLAETPRGLNRIAEVGEPNEVQHLSELCRNSNGVRSVSNLQTWLQQSGLQSGIPDMDVNGQRNAA